MINKAMLLIHITYTSQSGLQSTMLLLCINISNKLTQGHLSDNYIERSAHAHWNE